jgi:hypothetical protein
MNRVGTLDGRKKYPTGRWGEYRSAGRSTAWGTPNKSRLEAEELAAAEACREDIIRSHFAGGDITPHLTKGDARPLWKPHNIVPASRGGVNIESYCRRISTTPERELTDWSYVVLRLDQANFDRMADQTGSFVDSEFFH